MTDFRPLNAAAYPRPMPCDPGPAPMLQWIDLDLLVVDDRYQREIGGRGRKNINAIAAAFNWSKFSPVVVAPVTGGRFAIIDGQHRCTAALVAGIPSVPCQVVQADRVQQARAFAAVNSAVTRMSPIQMFWSRVEALDENAVRTVAVCERADVVLLRYPKPADKIARNETMCVSGVEQLVLRLPEAAVITGMQCITECGGEDGYSGLLNRLWITVLVELMAREPEWCEAGERLFRALDEIDFYDLDERCAQEARRRKVPRSTALRQAIEKHLTAVLGGDA